MFVTVDLAVLAAAIVAVAVFAAIVFVGPALRARKGIADQELARNSGGGRRDYTDYRDKDGWDS